MKKLLFLSLLVIGTNQLKADDYLYLTFTNTDGTERSLSVDGLRIIFENGEIKANANEEALSIALADVAKMYFSNTKAETTGISDMEVSNEGVTVYTTSGMFVGHFNNAIQAHNKLDKGLYVIKTNGRTYKMAVK